MENANFYGISMNILVKLDLDEGGKKVKEILFRGMIGSLLYLTTGKPNMLFGICMCACFQANPKKSHLFVVKWILRYLKGTSHMDLWYPKSNSCYLICYINANYAGNRTNRKSTNGDCQFIGHSLVSWHSKNKNKNKTK